LHNIVTLSYNKQNKIILYTFYKPGSRDSVDGIVTGYGLGGPGIEYRWRARFSAPFQTGSESRPVSYTMSNESFQGVKRPGRGVDHPPSSSAEVKEKVELYIYTPSWLRGLF
jgi:hypothetical protein